MTDQEFQEIFPDLQKTKRLLKDVLEQALEWEPDDDHAGDLVWLIAALDNVSADELRQLLSKGLARAVIMRPTAF